MPLSEIEAPALFAETAGLLLETRDLEEASSIVLEGALRTTASSAGLAGYVDPVTGSLICRTAGATEPDCAMLREWWSHERREGVVRNGPGERFASSPARLQGAVLGHIVVAGAEGDYGGEVLGWLERIANLYARSIRRIRQDMSAENHHERLRAAVAAAPIGIAALDLDGRVVLWNDGAQRIFGWEEQEVMGGLPPTIPGDKEEDLKAVYRDLMAQGGRVDYELRRRRKDGREIDLAVSMAPSRDRRDALTGMVAAYADLTDRREAERLLVRANQELARSNAELEQFAYVASHDLQEPLRMITGYLQLIEKKYKESLDSDGREFIGFAVDGAMRMRALINALLEYSRIGSRGREFLPCKSDDALDRALSNLQAAVADSGAAICRGQLPEVTADSLQLTQLFQNLIGNALKFRGARRPEIRVEARTCESGWVFSVRDNGIGIPEEHRDRIFEIFQRLHSREEYEGTGIGLAISKRIVERHGGRIWVESAAGEGSTFHFTIPDRP